MRVHVMLWLSHAAVEAWREGAKPLRHEIIKSLRVAQGMLVQVDGERGSILRHADQKKSGEM